MDDVPAPPIVLRRLARDLRADLDSADGSLAEVQEATDSSAEAITGELRSTLRQLRADVGSSLAELEAFTGDQRLAYLDEARRRLDAGRGVLDDLRVQVSVEGDEARQQAALLLEATDNAWLAVRRRVDEARRDAAGTAGGSGRIGQALHELHQGLVEARAVFRRTADR